MTASAHKEVSGDVSIVCIASLCDYVKDNSACVTISYGIYKTNEGTIMVASCVSWEVIISAKINSDILYHTEKGNQVTGEKYSM